MKRGATTGSPNSVKHKTQVGRRETDGSLTDSARRMAHNFDITGKLVAQNMWWDFQELMDYNQNVADSMEGGKEKTELISDIRLFKSDPVRWIASLAEESGIKEDQYFKYRGRRVYATTTSERPLTVGQFLELTRDRRPFAKRITRAGGVSMKKPKRKTSSALKERGRKISIIMKKTGMKLGEASHWLKVNGH